MVYLGPVGGASAPQTVNSFECFSVNSTGRHQRKTGRQESKTINCFVEQWHLHRTDRTSEYFAPAGLALRLLALLSNRRVKQSGGLQEDKTLDSRGNKVKRMLGAHWGPEWEQTMNKEKAKMK